MSRHPPFSLRPLVFLYNLSKLSSIALIIVIIVIIMIIVIIVLIVFIMIIVHDCAMCNCAGCAALNFYIGAEIYLTSRQLSYSWLCQPVLNLHFYHGFVLM